MNNASFLKILVEGVKRYSTTGSRSNSKLKVIHGAIKEDLYNRLLSEGGTEYRVVGLDVDGGKEQKVEGRYIADKSVDIAITTSENKHVGVLELKFVMQNYSQNSNNYFENMLGQTANMKTVGIPCFQVVVCFEQVPYFDKNGKISKIEKFTKHNMHKYIALSNDNDEIYFHSPNKTLFILLRNSKINESIIGLSKEAYFQTLNSIDSEISYSASSFNFGDLIIYNDYEQFAKKIVYKIKSI